MDNYDNFFGNPGDYGHTPIYHTPDPVDPNDNKKGKKFTVITVLFVVIAVIMCIAIVANVVVLAGMKAQVSQDYADSMTDALREEYLKAIEEYLDGREITEDVIAQIEENVIKELTTSAAVVAGTKTVYSTVQIVARGEKSTSYGSGFLITATDAEGNTARYVVTNAHVVLETVSETSSSGGSGFPWGSGGTITTTYGFQVRENITCSLMNGASGDYTLSVIPGGCGSYLEYIDNTSKPVSGDYKTKPDLAVLKFVSDEPDEGEYPSLNIATEGADYGDGVAIVGYPAPGSDPTQAVLSLSTGIISATAHKLTGWGYGRFYQTDSAINGGNSGGPMVNNKNEVVGIVESKITYENIENIGYAVTSMTLIDFLADAGLTPVTV